MSHLAPLPDRGVIELAGADRVGFLQGLVSNDVAAAAPGTAVWTALLTPQGKWLADFFILAEPDRLLLDVERAQAAMILPRLARFRLRAKAALADVSAGWAVHAAWDGLPALPADAIAARDPRLPEAGWRILAPAPLATDATAAEYDAHRLSLGLPDGSADLEAEKTVLLEAGFDELNGISWSKGCYMGQELTARTRYRGLVKRRLVPVAVDGPLPPPGTPVLRDGAEVGTIRSGRGGRALATLRLEALRAPVLTAGEARLVPRIPAWMRLPEPAA
jgi:folate-binding protein YgfZ